MKRKYRIDASLGLCSQKNKTEAEIEAAQALFNGQRMEKQELATSCPHGERD